MRRGREERLTFESSHPSSSPPPFPLCPLSRSTSLSHRLSLMTEKDYGHKERRTSQSHLLLSLFGAYVRMCATEIHTCFLHNDYYDETSTLISLGQIFCENVCLFKYGSQKKSGQVTIVHFDYLVIRSAKPYLATPGATVHGHYGETLHEGDTLVTFIYEKSRSGDITQGLPKVEQVLEVRSIDSISTNLEKRVKAWNERISRILGNPWGFLISTELTIAQSRISLVNKIQKVYRSQGVQIHNRHLEIIVRQVTSKVLTDFHCA